MTVTQEKIGWRSYALGVFILFQLVYLPAANCIKLIALRLPESTGELDDDIQLHGQQFPERVQALADGIGTAFVRYGELTGQAQGWSLFAPVFGHQASLPMLAVDWSAKPGPKSYAYFESEFARKQDFVSYRLPSTNCRRFNYEYRLALLFWTFEAGTYEAHRDDWDEALKRRVRRQYRSIQAFLNWRFSQLAARFPPGQTPVALLLCAKLYPDPEVLKDLYLWVDTNYIFMMAHWTPGLTPPPGMAPVQAWSKGLVWLPIEGPP
jgi:hypothetical protein